MYEELVNTLLYDAGWLEQGIAQTERDIAEHLKKAADAIEELSKALEAVNDAHNEGYDVGYWAGRRDYEPKWIPVTERLPKDGEAVNVAWINHSPAIYYQHIKDKPLTATGVYYRGQWYW